MSSGQKADTSKTIIGILNSVYGPYAFGITSLLIIWFAIVAPEIEDRRVDHAANEQIIQQLHQAHNDQLVVAQTMERTADSLSTTAQILERIMEKNGD